MPATAAPAWLANDVVDALVKETSSGRYVNPSKLEENKEHRFRFFGTGITGYEVWTTDNKPVRYVEKPADADLPPNVKFEENGAPSVRRFIAGLVFDYAAEEFKILQLTQKGLMNSLFKYIQDADYGDPCGYDIKIQRKGSGLKTEYTLVPSPPKEPAAAIRAQYDEMHCNLEALFEGKDPFDAPQA
jgi:hypothetical protein